MLNFFNRFSNKKLILILSALVVLMVGVVVLYAYSLLNETIFTVVLFLLIIAFSTITSSMMQRHLQKKFDNKKKGKVYSFNEKITFAKPLKSLNANFGKVDLYLENKVLYVLIDVKDAEVFFSEEQQQVKYNVDKKKYDKLIQFYIFDNKDYSYFRKISIINYQSENFYVGSFIIDNDNKTIYQSDNVKRNDEYQPIYDNFLKLINITKD